MFSFSAASILHHVTILPTSTTFDHAVRNLHNHELLIRLDPEHDHYETLLSEPNTPETKRYKVTDIMQTLPKGLWGSTVTFEAQMTDTDDGVLWVVKAPLGLLQKTTWRLMKVNMLAENDIKSANVAVEGDKGEWALVEDVNIEANRLILGVATGKCEASWRTAHGKFAKSLHEGEAKTAGA